MSGRSELETDSVRVDGLLTLGEFTVTGANLSGGVLTISPSLQGVTMIVDAGVSLSGIKVVDTDGTTDITTACGGMTMFIATDAEPYPQAFTVKHDDATVATLAHRFDCPAGSGGVRTDVTIGRLQTSIRYSGVLQRWIMPNWNG